MTSMTVPRRGQNPLTRHVELRGHTDDEGDRLTPQGAADAEMIGRDGLRRPTPRSFPPARPAPPRLLEILRHAAGQDDTSITAATGLRSSVENRWREAAKAAGRGSRRCGAAGRGRAPQARGWAPGGSRSVIRKAAEAACWRTRIAGSGPGGPPGPRSAAGCGSGRQARGRSLLGLAALVAGAGRAGVGQGAGVSRAVAGRAGWGWPARASWERAVARASSASRSGVRSGICRR
jgi:hypothetical protein